MKKWLTLLLLLITLAGTFYPCCQVDECSEGEIATAQKENEKQTEGNCSPFFACAACAGFDQMYKPIEIIQMVVENQIHHEKLVVFNFITYASSFWQPPRFC